MSEKIGKILSCTRPDERLQELRMLFEWSKSNHCFVNADKDLPKSKSFVIPYSILTDGHDVICMVNNARVLELGLANMIRKPWIYWKSEKNFDRLVYQGIVGQFKEVFDGITIRESPESEERHLEDSDVSLISTHCAIKSIDLMQVYPLYFVKIRSDALIRIPDSLEGIGLTPLDMDWITSDEAMSNMPHVSKMTAMMLREGLISLPERQKGFV